MRRDKIEKEIRKIYNGNILTNVPMKIHTSLRIGGPADFFISPVNEEQLIKTIEFSKKFNIPYFVIGLGTNILVSDKGIRGIVIKTTNLKGYNFIDNKLRCNAGISLSRLLNLCIKKELSGLEFSSGIPGTIGGAIITNAGTELGTISDVLISILGFKNGEEVYLKKDDIDFKYRTCKLNSSFVILGAEILLKDDNQKNIKERINFLKEKRRKTQPSLSFSCGCVFKNPDGNYAGWLIEKSGLKGKNIGDAIVSKKHANFIINSKSATCKDFIRLMREVQETVYKKFNILLEEEIKIIGEF